MRGGRYRGTARAGIAARQLVASTDDVPEKGEHPPRARSVAVSMMSASGKFGRSCGVEGIRTSPERVRRLMRAHDLQAPHRVGQAHGPTVQAARSPPRRQTVMSVTDMTATVTVAARLRPACSWPSITAGPSFHRSACGPERQLLRGPGARPRRYSANASAGAAWAHAGLAAAASSTTRRTTWVPISNRRSRSSGLRVPRAKCERPKVTA